MLRIYVIGRIGRPGQNERIEYAVNALRNRGFNVTSALDRGVYEERDWKTDHAGARRILAEVEDFFATHDFDVVVADLSTASDGRTNEQILAEIHKIPVYGFVFPSINVTTPFRIARIEEGKLFTDIDDLAQALHEFEAAKQTPPAAD